MVSNKMKQLIKKHYEKHSQFLLFLVIGGVNTCFGFSIFSLLIFLDLHYTVAVFFSTCLGVLFNFKTTGYIVFKNTNYLLFFKFVLVYTVIYFLNIGIIKLCLFAQPNVYAAGLVSTIICALVSYALNKNFVFAKEPA